MTGHEVTKPRPSGVFCFCVRPTVLTIMNDGKMVRDNTDEIATLKDPKNPSAKCKKVA
jgi:hypothetical protein